VLRLFSRLNIGGPSLHVILLNAGLDARGYDTRLVIGKESEREGNLLEFAQEKGVRYHQLAALGREIRPLGDMSALWELYRMMRELRPTIVHTHTAKAGVVGRLAARLAGVPVVVHTFHGHVLRGYFGATTNTFYRNVERWLAVSSDLLVAVSDAVADELAALGVARRERFHVVPVGLELERLTGALPWGVLRKEAGFADDAPLVGVVGRLVPIKDIDGFLAAAELVAREAPAVRFSIVGDGKERARLEARAASLGLEERVHFHGWKRDQREVFGDLDLVVNCSRNEGTPVALVEALTAGCPVVATRVGGTPDVLEKGRFGTLVEPGDPAALARAILDVIRDPAPARDAARRARPTMLERYAVDRLVDDIDRLYRELLDIRGHA
jgi:glycosyltransferase involved in cell wall biosynthesis